MLCTVRCGVHANVEHLDRIRYYYFCLLFCRFCAVGSSSTARWLLAVCCRAGCRCVLAVTCVSYGFISFLKYTQVVCEFMGASFFLCLKSFYSFGTLKYKTVAKTFSACSLLSDALKKRFCCMKLVNTYTGQIFVCLFGLLNLKTLQNTQFSNIKIGANSFLYELLEMKTDAKWERSPDFSDEEEEIVILRLLQETEGDFVECGTRSAATTKARNEIRNRIAEIFKFNANCPCARCVLRYSFQFQQNIWVFISLHSPIDPVRDKWTKVIW